MAAALSLDYVFTPSAGQTYTFTVLGETPATVSYDETITLNVKKATMDSVLTYASSWSNSPGSSGASGSVVGPAVGLLLQTVLGSYFDSLTMGLTGATTGTSYAYDTATSKVIGDGGSNCNTLVYQFQQLSGFTYTSPGVGTTDLLSSIPQEAIKGFTVTDITTAPLSGVVGDPYVVPGGSTGPFSGISGAIQSLFEQAVNYGMVPSTAGTDYSQTTVVGASGATLGLLLGTTGTVSAVQFEVDQTLAIYVEFQLQKIRKYNIDSVVSSGVTGATGSTQLTFGGVGFTLAGLTETSEPKPVTYRVLLNTVSDVKVDE
jgi:hypothetical protein